MGAPPIPPSITTSYTILRGIIHGLFGLPQKEKRDSSLQCTFLKDKPQLTGKFSIQLGKKFGSKDADIALGEKVTEEQKELFWTLLSTVMQDIISKEIPISVWVEEDVSAVERKYGKEVILEYPSKKEWSRKMVMCYIPNLILTSLPLASYSNINGEIGDGHGDSKVLIYSNTKYLKQVDILRSEGNHWESNMTSTAKKTDIAVKFDVVRVATMEEEENFCCKAASSSEGMPSKEDVQRLMEKRARLDDYTSTLRDIFGTGQEETQQQTAPTPAPTHAESAEEEEEEEEMLVNAFEVKGKIDYNKLIENFGSQLITPDLLTRLSKLVEQRRISPDIPLLHHFLRRGIFFSHRDLDKLVTALEKGKDGVYLYTGRGPSSTAMHLGHLVPFLFTQWLQSALNLPLVIQMTDDEKFIFKGEYIDGEYNLPSFQQLTVENAKDIIACGFIKEKTFIFSNMEYVGNMYPNIVRIWKSVTTNAVNGIFGFDGMSNIGKIAFPAIQAAPSFSSSFYPNVLQDKNMICCIPCAIDQDPYFRMTRDVAHKLVDKKHALGGKPSLIHSKFFPPLQGVTGKMSSSDPNTAIFLTDSIDTITKKIKQFAYSGGQELLAKQKEIGANLEVDISYQWLHFFYQDDDELATIAQQYGSGKGDKYWSTKFVKEKLVDVLVDLVGKHQEKRELVTDSIVREWMDEHLLH